MSAEAPARKKKCSMMGAPRWRGRGRIDAGADTGRPTGADRGRAAGRAPGARVPRHTGPGRTHCLQTTYAHATRSIGDASRTSRITNFFFLHAQNLFKISSSNLIFPSLSASSLPPSPIAPIRYQIIAAVHENFGLCLSFFSYRFIIIINIKFRVSLEKKRSTSF